MEWDRGSSERETERNVYQWKNGHWTMIESHKQLFNSVTVYLFVTQLKIKYVHISWTFYTPIC